MIMLTKFKHTMHHLAFRFTGYYHNCGTCGGSTHILCARMRVHVHSVHVTKDLRIAQPENIRRYAGVLACSMLHFGFTLHSVVFLSLLLGFYST